jgi:Protein of unknown function (DUF3263)
MERADRDVGGVPGARKPEPEPGIEPEPGTGQGEKEKPGQQPDELTEPERAILDFEKRWWRRPGAKEQAIRETFDLSPTRYYQQLNALLDRPAAVAYDPALVNRLRRLRGGRTSHGA